MFTTGSGAGSAIVAEHWIGHLSPADWLFSWFSCISRHSVVCHAAQEAVTSHHEYIDRKTKKVVFAPI